MARKASYSRVLPPSTRSDQNFPPVSSFPSVENPFACEASVSCLSWFNLFVWIQVLRVIFRGRAFASPTGANSAVVCSVISISTPSPIPVATSPIPASLICPKRSGPLLATALPVTSAIIKFSRVTLFIRTYVNIAPAEPCTWASLLPIATGKRVGMPGRTRSLPPTGGRTSRSSRCHKACADASRSPNRPELLRPNLHARPVQRRAITIRIRWDSRNTRVDCLGAPPPFRSPWS